MLESALDTMELICKLLSTFSKVSHFQIEFDVVSYSTPIGLEDASKYPVLFAELMGAGWTVEELTKLAGGNFLRVMREVETIRDKMRTNGVRPYEDILTNRNDDPFNCTTN